MKCSTKREHFVAHRTFLIPHFDAHRDSSDLQQSSPFPNAMCVKANILGCDMQQEEDLASAMGTCDVRQNSNILYSDMQ
jgi:hypothetical protein